MLLPIEAGLNWQLSPIIVQILSHIISSALTREQQIVFAAHMTFWDCFRMRHVHN